MNWSHGQEAAWPESREPRPTGRRATRSAFDEIVAANLKRFQSLARAYSDGSDYQDLLQGILLQAWRSLPRFRGEARLETWVYRVALNTAISYLRTDILGMNTNQLGARISRIKAAFKKRYTEE
jgi:RNA polymerase sigma-70 factor (ECF subfamily)